MKILQAHHQRQSHACSADTIAPGPLQRALSAHDRTAPGSVLWKPGGLERASSWLISGLGLWLGSKPFSREDGSGEGRAPEECRRPIIFPTSSLLAELFARTCKRRGGVRSQSHFMLRVPSGNARRTKAALPSLLLCHRCQTTPNLRKPHINLGMAVGDTVHTRSDARSMRPVTSPDMGERGGSPWRNPKLALWDGESLVLFESLLLGVILHSHWPVTFCTLVNH